MYTGPCRDDVHTVLAQHEIFFPAVEQIKFFFLDSEKMYYVGCIQ